MKLEVVVVPVSDVDPAKRFYETLGFRLDIDHVGRDDFRVVQLPPPGSECSIIIGKGITPPAPGSVQGLQLVVAARADLVSRGVDVSEVFHDAGGVFHHVGEEQRVSGPHPDRIEYGSFASFSDPDGNGWMLQMSASVEGSAMDPTTEILLDALKRAAAAHGVHEEKLGKPGPDSPQWYAQHMARTLTEDGYRLSGPKIQ